MDPFDLNHSQFEFVEDERISMALLYIRWLLARTGLADLDFLTGR